MFLINDLLYCSFQLPDYCLLVFAKKPKLKTSKCVTFPFQDQLLSRKVLAKTNSSFISNKSSLSSNKYLQIYNFNKFTVCKKNFHFHIATVVKLYNYTSWQEVSYSVCKACGSHVSVGKEVNSTLPTDAFAAVQVLHGKKFNV